MDLIELKQVMDFAHMADPWNTLILFMIWWTARGIRKDLSDYKTATNTKLDIHEKKLNDHEGRIIRLENP